MNWLLLKIRQRLGFFIKKIKNVYSDVTFKMTNSKIDIVRNFKNLDAF